MIKLVIPSVGSQRDIHLSRIELAMLLEYFQIDAVNNFSPLPYLCQSDLTGNHRSVNEILKNLPWLNRSNAKDNFLPLIAPDRVMDVSFALFGQKPKKMRFYANRRALHLIAVTVNSNNELSLTLPLFPDLVVGWLENCLQFSGKLSFSAPFDTFSAKELSFLFALVDTYKSNLFGSYNKHQETPLKPVITPQQVFNQALTGQQTIDLRFLVSSMHEIFSEMVHVGGLSQLGLPPIDSDFINNEISRYQNSGHLLSKDNNLTYELSTPLVSLAADLSQWINIICLHDIQINSSAQGKNTAIEEMLCFIGTQTTIWSLVSEGFTNSKNDFIGVNFGFRSGSTYAMQDLIKAFLQTLPMVSIDPAFYAETISLKTSKVAMSLPKTENVPNLPKYCRFCGKETLSDTKFCRHCGKPLLG
jgi:hypothetical protein